MQRAALCGWVFFLWPFIYSVSSSKSGVGWWHCSCSLLGSLIPLPLVAHICCAAALVTPGGWRIQPSFPSSGSVSISWTLDSLGDQAASLSRLLFQLGGVPANHSSEAENPPGFLGAVGKIPLKYSFYKIMPCTPCWGKIPSFSWIFAWSSLHAKKILWKILVVLCVHKHFFNHLTCCFKETFLYTCVSLNLSPVNKSSVGVILLEEKQLCDFDRAALRDEQQW